LQARTIFFRIRYTYPIYYIHKTLSRLFFIVNIKAGFTHYGQRKSKHRLASKNLSE